jgi:hypothetical protein
LLASLSTWRALWIQALLASFSPVLPKRSLHAELDGKVPVNKDLSIRQSVCVFVWSNMEEELCP